MDTTINHKGWILDPEALSKIWWITNKLFHRWKYWFKKSERARDVTISVLYLPSTAEIGGYTNSDGPSLWHQDMTNKLLSAIVNKWFIQSHIPGPGQSRCLVHISASFDQWLLGMKWSSAHALHSWCDEFTNTGSIPVHKMSQGIAAIITLPQEKKSKNTSPTLTVQERFRRLSGHIRKFDYVLRNLFLSQTSCTNVCCSPKITE